MRFLKTYGRVLGLLGRDLRIAGLLAGTNMVVAGLQFLDPVLFGRVVGLLSRSDRSRRPDVAAEPAPAGLWAGVGLIGIGSNILCLGADRAAGAPPPHRGDEPLFPPRADLPLSFHGEAHSGRVIKTMLTGTDALFGTWLVFFRDQLSTVLSVVVLLPLTLFLNWRLALVLIVLVCCSCA